MIVGAKDVIRLIGISIVCFCAVFVCTFFINFYLDVSGLQDIPPTLTKLYDAQMATARFVCGICGGFLGAIAILMLIFYIRLFIGSHTVLLGTLKAMGYSDGRIASKFWVFGLSVLLGAALGYGCGHAAMPYIYDSLLIQGLPDVAITYHPALLFALVVAPAALYSALSVLFAYIALKKPVSELLRGKAEKVKTKPEKDRDRPFLREMFFKCVSSRKLLAFFVAFGAFCFSAMVQMGFSMDKVSADSMSELIISIGLVLAVVSLAMAITSLVNANAENVSIMKSFGYGLKDCMLAVFGGFVPFALIGFAVGTVYQFGLLKLMVNIIFKGVEGVGEYTFDVPLLFITLAAFIAFYAALMLLYAVRLKRISIKQTANE